MGKARVTPKENFLKLRHGGMPEYVPFYSLMGDPYKGENPCTGAMIQMFEAAEPREDGRFTDIWGVPYVTTRETGYSPLLLGFLLCDQKPLVLIRANGFIYWNLIAFF